MIVALKQNSGEFLSGEFGNVFEKCSSTFQPKELEGLDQLSTELITCPTRWEIHSDWMRALKQSFFAFCLTIAKRAKHCASDHLFGHFTEGHTDGSMHLKKMRLYSGNVYRQAAFYIRLKWKNSGISSISGTRLKSGWKWLAKVFGCMKTHQRLPRQRIKYNISIFLEGGRLQHCNIYSVRHAVSSQLEVALLLLSEQKP